MFGETVDPDGRRVVLDDLGWTHILEEHEEMEAYPDAILETVGSPDHRGQDPRRARERYWQRQAGPSRWLKVVVDFNAEPGRVITAYANRQDPPGWTP